MPQACPEPLSFFLSLGHMTQVAAWVQKNLHASGRLTNTPLSACYSIRDKCQSTVWKGHLLHEDHIIQHKVDRRERRVKYKTSVICSRLEEKKDE